VKTAPRPCVIVDSTCTGYQMNTFVFWPEDDRERQSRVFAEGIVPAGQLITNTM
jgi:hypothetical protein